MDSIAAINSIVVQMMAAPQELNQLMPASVGQSAMQSSRFSNIANNYNTPSLHQSFLYASSSQRQSDESNLNTNCLHTSSASGALSLKSSTKQSTGESRLTWGTKSKLAQEGKEETDTSEITSTLINSVTYNKTIENSVVA